MTTYESREQAINELKNDNPGEIMPGVYLYTQDEIIEEQKEWSDVDESKHIDFTAHAYWITTAQHAPEGFDSIEDLVDDYIDALVMPE